MTTDHSTLPDVLTVPYILAARPLTAAANKKKTSKKVVDNTKQFLKENGVLNVQVLDVDAQKAAAILQDPAFWEQHYSLHPQKARVKNWLMVHEQHRSQADKLLELTQEMDCPEKLLVAFLKLHKKIDSHNEFEDHQLFKFFVDHKIGNQDNLKKLMMWHDGIQASKDIAPHLESLVSSRSSKGLKEQVKQEIEKDVQDLKDHMDLEEKTLIGPWLQLSPAEYKKYRSYFSWKHSFVY